MDNLYLIPLVMIQKTVILAVMTLYSTTWIFSVWVVDKIQTCTNCTVKRNVTTKFLLNFYWILLHCYSSNADNYSNHNHNRNKNYKKPYTPGEIVDCGGCNFQCYCEELPLSDWESDDRHMVLCMGCDRIYGHLECYGYGLFEAWNSSFNKMSSEQLYSVFCLIHTWTRF